MGKMSDLDIERTNEMVGMLDNLAQYIDNELVGEMSPISLVHSRLMYMQGLIEGYKDWIKRGVK